MEERKTKIPKMKVDLVKYVITANFTSEGALEITDVLGGLFGQMEGLLGNELELSDLQRRGKVGIKISLNRESDKTLGTIQILSALDKAQTCLVASAIETICILGNAESKIDVQGIEDVRKEKKDFVMERAKELIGKIG